MGQACELTAAEKAKDARLRRIYKITLAEFNAKKSAQGNKCAICKRSFDDYMAHQDHDHKCCPPGRKKQREYCGKCNRDIICYLCNRWIVGGLEFAIKMGIDPEAALKYVLKWGMRGKEKATTKRPSKK